jgi:hypothetical protein
MISEYSTESFQSGRRCVATERSVAICRRPSKRVEAAIESEMTLLFIVSLQLTLRHPAAPGQCARELYQIK